MLQWAWTRWRQLWWFFPLWNVGFLELRDLLQVLQPPPRTGMDWEHQLWSWGGWIKTRQFWVKNDDVWGVVPVQSPRSCRDLEAGWSSIALMVGFHLKIIPTSKHPMISWSSASSENPPEMRFVNPSVCLCVCGGLLHAGKREVLRDNWISLLVSPLRSRSSRERSGGFCLGECPSLLHLCTSGVLFSPLPHPVLWKKNRI